MEIGRQIRKYRLELKLSQEELADKVYVTRQTVSNWENDKNYPDINSLVLLSSLFGISLDVLVKGDLKEMEKMIREEDVKKLNRDAWIYTILLVVTVVSIVPLFFFLWPAGSGIWICIYAVTMYFAHRIEKQKKEYDIGTYKEIKMFMEGKRLDEIEKIREEGKRPYQKWSLALLIALIAFAVVVGICMVFDHLGMI
ncbi:MAG TPA: helix-turn-helix domain-containing protein [Candidatus Mediterraneibacter norfolkensis]|nr:helix-turn-helix domain-containing protein [Candidatus Mediterraneibacter norfolkensis]